MKITNDAAEKERERRIIERFCPAERRAVALGVWATRWAQKEKEAREWAEIRATVGAALACPHGAATVLTCPDCREAHGAPRDIETRNEA